MPEPQSPRQSTGNAITVILLVAVAVMLIVLVLKLRAHSGSASSEMGVHYPAVGKKLSKLELQPLTGGDEPVSLASLRGDGVRPGKVTLLNFWGTWCRPCVTEMPDLAAIDAHFRNEVRFSFLPVSVGYDREDPEELKQETSAFMARAQYKFATYYDRDFITRTAVFELVHDEVTPLTIILDRQGVIRGVWPGYDPKNGQQMTQLILELLKD